MTSTQITMNAIRELTPAQRRVLDQIAVGNDGGHNPRTVEKLVKRGLVVAREETMAPTCGCPFAVVVARYEMPIGAHMAWAALCDKEIP